MCPSQLNVDLAAIDANLALAGKFNPGRAVLLPVKADAYGHGIVPVARHVEAVGSAQWLGVAEVSEAEQLRAGGVGLPVLKFSPCFPDELDRAIAARLTLCVGDSAGITAAQEAAERAGTRHPVHLKVDTGMRRVGAEPAGAVALARQIADSPSLILQGVFTHLPISDTPEGNDYTRDQLARFLATVDAIRDAVGEIPLVHAGNSGAVLGHDLAGTNLCAAHATRRCPPAPSRARGADGVGPVPPGRSRRPGWSGGACGGGGATRTVRESPQRLVQGAAQDTGGRFGQGQAPRVHLLGGLVAAAAGGRASSSFAGAGNGLVAPRAGALGSAGGGGACSPVRPGSG